MKVTREMICAAHYVTMKHSSIVLSAELLESIYLAMDALANRHKTSGSPFCYHDGRNVVDPQHKDDVDVFPLYREASPRVPKYDTPMGRLWGICADETSEPKEKE